MDGPSHFHTQKGYELAGGSPLTAAMEDYLEMLCRLCSTEGFTRVHLLAERLNVQPSSASKMVDGLKREGLVRAEKYGLLCLTPRGEEVGRYLLYRHGVLHRALCLLNHTDSELEQTERIEHFIDRRTVENLARLLEQHDAPPR